MEPLTYQTGLDGFLWWVGVIESTDDTLHLGRAKVRIIGHHGTKDDLSTNQLPWAVPVFPITHSTRVPNYRPGDWVVGWFLDGKLGQQPMIFGVFPSIPQAQEA